MAALAGQQNAPFGAVCPSAAGEHKTPPGYAG